MAASNRSSTLAFSVTIDHARSQRGIQLVVAPVDESKRLEGRQATIVVSLWREGPSVIRGTITHASGAVAYFQGSEPLVEMARLLRLGVTRDDEQW